MGVVDGVRKEERDEDAVGNVARDDDEGGEEDFVAEWDNNGGDNDFLFIVGCAPDAFGDLCVDNVVDGALFALAFGAGSSFKGLDHEASTSGLLLSALSSLWTCFVGVRETSVVVDEALIEGGEVNNVLKEETSYNRYG